MALRAVRLWLLLAALLPLTLAAPAAAVVFQLPGRNLAAFGAGIGLNTFDGTFIPGPLGGSYFAFDFEAPGADVDLFLETAQPDGSGPLSIRVVGTAVGFIVPETFAAMRQSLGGTQRNQFDGFFKEGLWSLDVTFTQNLAALSTALPRAVESTRYNVTSESPVNRGTLTNPLAETADPLLFTFSPDRGAVATLTEEGVSFATIDGTLGTGEPGVREFQTWVHSTLPDGGRSFSGEFWFETGAASIVPEPGPSFLLAAGLAALLLLRPRSGAGSRRTTVRFPIR